MVLTAYRQFFGTVEISKRIIKINFPGFLIRSRWLVIVQVFCEVFSALSLFILFFFHFGLRNSRCEKLGAVPGEGWRLCQRKDRVNGARKIFGTGGAEGRIGAGCKKLVIRMGSIKMFIAVNKKTLRTTSVDAEAFSFLRPKNVVSLFLLASISWVLFCAPAFSSWMCLFFLSPSKPCPFWTKTPHHYLACRNVKQKDRALILTTPKPVINSYTGGIALCFGFKTPNFSALFFFVGSFFSLLILVNAKCC